MRRGGGGPGGYFVLPTSDVDWIDIAKAKYVAGQRTIEGLEDDLDVLLGSSRVPEHLIPGSGVPRAWDRGLDA